MKFQFIRNWLNKKLFSTNHKDIGTLYLILGSIMWIDILLLFLVKKHYSFFCVYKKSFTYKNIIIYRKQLQFIITKKGQLHISTFFINYFCISFLWFIYLFYFNFNLEMLTTTAYCITTEEWREITETRWGPYDGPHPDNLGLENVDTNTDGVFFGRFYNQFRSYSDSFFNALDVFERTRPGSHQNAWLLQFVNNMTTINTGQQNEVMLALERDYIQRFVDTLANSPNAGIVRTYPTLNMGVRMIETNLQANYAGNNIVIPEDILSRLGEAHVVVCWSAVLEELGVGAGIDTDDSGSVSTSPGSDSPINSNSGSVLTGYKRRRL